MLSKEEQKAIKVLEQYKNECIEEYKIELDDVEENIDQQHTSYLRQQIEATNIVLNLTDRLLKEKEENKYLIAMANNEMLGYNQGYADGKNQNSSATEIIVKNMQDYIHKEETKLLQKEIEKKDKRLDRQFKLLNKRDKQIQQALKIAFDYGQADGEHHKAWVIDQMVRALTGKEYDKWINDYIYDEETGDSYTWDKGIAP